MNKSLEHLARLGIVQEVTQRQRDRIFSYGAYAAVLNEGMQLPADVRGE